MHSWSQEKSTTTIKETNITAYGYSYASILIEKDYTYDHTYNHRNKMQLPRLQVSLQVDDPWVPCVYQASLSAKTIKHLLLRSAIISVTKTFPKEIPES